MSIDSIEAQLNMEETAARMNDPDMHPILEVIALVWWTALAWLFAPSRPETFYDPNK
jgi:hypothetical protein